MAPTGVTLKPVSGGRSGPARLASDTGEGPQGGSPGVPEASTGPTRASPPVPTVGAKRPDLEWVPPPV